MKKLFLTTSLVLTAISISFAISPADIAPNYFILKDRQFNQTDASAPVLATGNAYQFINYLEGASANTIVSGTLTPAVGGTGGGFSLSNINDGRGDFMGGPQYQTLAELDGAYVNGTYTTSGTGLNRGGFTASLSLSGTFTNLPQITGGTWSFGNLMASNASLLTLNWSLLTPGSTSDAIFVRIEENITHQIQTQVILSGTATTYTLPALLATGSYNAMIGYISVSDTNTSLNGSTGYAGHLTETDVTIASVPEPSSIALLLTAGISLVSGRSLFRKFRR
jgi:hypothetical protein